MEVRLSKRALNDVEKIFLYTEEMWGIEQRIKVATGIKLVLHFLENYPDCGQSTNRSSVSTLVVTKLPFVFLYKINNSNLIILRVRHSKQLRK